MIRNVNIFFLPVSSKHTETKQFFTLYNTLDDTKSYLSKEVQLLNSIHDNFQPAMASPANRDVFLKQFEQMVDGVKQNKAKVGQISDVTFTSFFLFWWNRITTFYMCEICIDWTLNDLFK